MAGELLHALGVPRMLYPCGGLTDSSLGGNGRRWATGEPSLPLELLDKHRVASPGVILDELEKAGSSTQNGWLHDVLLAMLEPVSAVEWTDPYVQAPVDLSHIVWVATANKHHRRHPGAVAGPMPGPAVPGTGSGAPAAAGTRAAAAGLHCPWAGPAVGSTAGWCRTSGGGPGMARRVIAPVGPAA